MAKDEKRGSLKPEDATQGGAIPSGWGKIVSAEFCHFNYDEREKSKDSDDPFGLGIEFEMEEGDHEENPFQFYSGGKDRVATKDGKGFTGAAGLPSSSNAMEFIKSLIKAGYDDLDDDISVINGLRVLLEEKPQPDRQGRVGKAGKTFALIADIDKGGKKSSKPAAKANGKDTKAKDDDGDDENKAAQDWVAAKLKAKGNLTRKQLSQMAFKELSGEQRDTTIELIGDDDFIGADNAPWSFDGKELELA